MSTGWFHHPDVSLPVLTRRVTAELMDAFAWYGDLIASRGRSAWRNQSYASSAAYDNAVRRLKRRGILVSSRRKGGEPLLHVQPPDEGDRAVLDPSRWWGATWRGLWYVLVYDVPERNRRYRDHLRRVLLMHRCGCLQNSVWVTPRDLRPLFDDLNRAAGLGGMAHLFEARTVLGRGAEQIVAEAWDFGAIQAAHDRFQDDVRRAMALLRAGRLAPGEASAMAREELRAFRRLIQGDPLLPRSLHPDGYTGPASFRAHRGFVQAIRRRGDLV